MLYLWNQIGNPWTDSYYDNKGAVDFWYYHSLISDETYAEIQKNCDYKVEPAVGFSNSAACQNAANHASNLEMAEIDAYNIYAGNCNSASVNDSKVTKVSWNSDCMLYAVSALSPGLRKLSNINNKSSKKKQWQRVLLWAVLYQLYTNNLNVHKKTSNFSRELWPTTLMLYRQDQASSWDWKTQISVPLTRPHHTSTCLK